MLTRTAEPIETLPVLDTKTCCRCGACAAASEAYCDACGASLALEWGAAPPSVQRRRIGGTRWTPRGDTFSLVTKRRP